MNEKDLRDFDTDVFLQNVAKRFCPQCGTVVLQNKTGRPRKFCSQECTRQWWNSHEKPEHWKSAKVISCRFCGKEFLSTKELYRPRKYCSRSCSNKGRAKKGGNEIE